MSTANPTPEPEQTRASAAKPQRVLACVLCQQRKVKCDREFPCQNCVRAGAQCVPTALAARQQRGRFSERELLERLGRYEDLLRQNNIDFEPLHVPVAAKAPPNADGRGGGSPDDAHPGRRATGPTGPSREKTTVKFKAEYEAKNLWHAMNQRSQDPDDGVGDDGSDSFPNDVRDIEVKKAWDQYESNDSLLFGSPKINVDISSLHPEQVQIFRLWQIYLENVNPLLKVTHTPTLQARIIDAAGDIARISPSLQALMFSIYCVSIHSLVEDECRTLFGSFKKDLLMNYQSSCQQALLKCGFLRSRDRDCLTALYLYLISVRPDTDARSLSSTLGAAVRIAQRMGIHNESANAKCTVLEAEMRRRLWWSLIIFDARISEKSHHKDMMLAPTWNCRTPLNVNDCDLWPEMKAPPAVHAGTTEALFVVVHSELNDFTRHSSYYLDFTNPILKSITKDVRHGSLLEGNELVNLEKTIENKYLKFCNPEHPLHFVTILTARACLAKNRLVEHYSSYSRSSVQQTDAQRNIAVAHALKMLECDTKLLASPLVKGYVWWFMKLQFPFPAYLHIVQDLRRRPVGLYAKKSWEALSDNYEARFIRIEGKADRFFNIFSGIILQAWAAREAVRRQSDEPEMPPRIVSNIRYRMTQMKGNARNSNIEQPGGSVGVNIDDFLTAMPANFIGDEALHSFGGQVLIDAELGAFPRIPGQATMGFNMNQLDWASTDENPMCRHNQ